MSTLAINAGSTSLKFGLFDDRSCERLAAGEIDWAEGGRHEARFVVQPRGGTTVRSTIQVSDDSTAAAYAIQALAGAGSPSPITAVGHRIVHGGADFRASVLIDQRVRAAIAQWSELAPLHNPPALKAIEAAEAALPGTPQVAVFDTAFYAHLPPEAYLYPVPYDWYQHWGIRRFGFHGISHAYCAARAADLLGREPAQLRLVSCHLAGGCSATAVHAGAAVATTSGFSPLDGLLMGTRSGAIDPGILLHLQRRHGLTPKELDRALNHHSGLLGISGVSVDLGQIEVAAAQGNARARLAWDMFAGQVRSALAGLAATLGGLDALVFTDRVGERSPSLRAAVCERLQFMGIRLDPHRNANAVADADIASPDSPVRVLVLRTEEELMVARETRRVLGP